jgi:hypothetical protein
MQLNDSSSWGGAFALVGMVVVRVIYVLKDFLQSRGSKNPKWRKDAKDTLILTIYLLVPAVTILVIVWTN